MIQRPRGTLRYKIPLHGSLPAREVPHSCGAATGRETSGARDEGRLMELNYDPKSHQARGTKSD